MRREKNKIKYKVAFLSVDNIWIDVAGGHNLSWAVFIIDLLLDDNNGWQNDKLAIFKKGVEKPVYVSPSGKK